jgi:2-keto-3-deoxy-6-phosphogluconate aldolase
MEKQPSPAASPSSRRRKNVPSNRSASSALLVKKALKALSAPFPQVRFIPTGGIDLSNLNDYLAFDKVQAVGGSFLLKGDIRANTEALMKQIACIRS